MLDISESNREGLSLSRYAVKFGEIEHTRDLANQRLVPSRDMLVTKLRLWGGMKRVVEGFLKTDTLHHLIGVFWQNEWNWHQEI